MNWCKFDFDDEVLGVMCWIIGWGIWVGGIEKKTRFKIFKLDFDEECRGRRGQGAYFQGDLGFGVFWKIGLVLKYPG